MADIPEDISKLKRPALQSLCKKYGIKANMKNVEMINALDEYKRVWMNTNQQSAEEQSDLSHAATPALSEPLPDPVQSSIEPLLDLAVKPLPDPVQSSTEPSTSESVQDPVELASDPVSDPVEHVSDPVEHVSDLVIEESTQATEPTSQVIRRTTFTSSNDIKISIEVNSSSTTIDDNTNIIPIEKPDNILIDMQVETDLNGSIRVRQITVSPVKEEESEEPLFPPSNDTLPIDGTPLPNDSTFPIDSTPPPSFPADRNNVGDTIVKKATSQAEEEEKEEVHNTTFTIESPEKDVPDPLAVLSDSLTYHTPIESPLRGAWALREEGKDTSLGRPLLDATYHKESGLAIVQRADDLGASPLLKPASDDKENNEDTTHASIMAILNERVAKTMADPSYVRPPPSKIPIPQDLKTSNTAKKFNAIHRKEFSKMTSISDVAAERQKRKRPIDKDNDPQLTSEKTQKRPRVEVTSHKKPVGTIGKIPKTPHNTGKKPSSLLSSKKKKERPPFRF